MFSKEEIARADEEYILLRKKCELELKESIFRSFSEKNAENIACEMTDFIDFLTQGDAMTWLGGLYDAERGGFYFSNSARDGEEFLPDLESTCQAIGYFYSSKASSHIAPTVREAFPEWFGKDVVRFVKKMQDPSNGYFYHPQWDKEATNVSLGRLGRDLNWAIRTLKYFDSLPTYDTPTGVCGSGIRFDGEKVDQSVKEFDQSSRIIKARPHLESKNAFKKLLEDLEPKLSVKSWEIGNRFESEDGIRAIRDKELEALGEEGGLCDLLASWFEKNQNEKTGMWTDSEEPSYDGTNGLLKICSAFNKINRRFPRPVEALSSAIKCIIKDDAPETVCHVLNPWYAVNLIGMNVNRFYGGMAEADEIEKSRRYIAENCVEMIRSTKKKLEKFKIGDGSFIYKVNRAGRSQGMRVAPDNVWEGDVNATTICARAIPEHIYEVLNFEMPPLYSGGDAMRFLNLLEEKKLRACQQSDKKGEI